MSNESKSMTLLNLETGKEFAIVRNTPNLNVRDELSAIMVRYQKMDADRIASSPQMGDDVIKFIREDTGSMKLIYESNAVARRQQSLKIIEMAKVIINKNKLAEENRVLVESDIESEHWRGQDLEALGEWVDGFCTRNGLG